MSCGGVAHAFKWSCTKAPRTVAYADNNHCRIDISRHNVRLQGQERFALCDSAGPEDSVMRV